MWRGRGALTDKKGYHGRFRIAGPRRGRTSNRAAGKADLTGKHARETGRWVCQTKGGPTMAHEARQLTLIKKGHYYLFRYLPGDEAALIQTLIEKAEDP